MKLLSDRLKTGHVIRVHSQAHLAGVVTIGSSPSKEETAATAPTPSGPVDDVVEQARQLAGSIIEEARQKARRLEEAGRQQLAQWRQQQEDELNRLREEARKEGYRTGWERGHAEGYRAGLAEAEAKWQQRLEEMNAHLQEALRLKQAMLAEAETEIIQLCIEIVRKIVGQMVRQQDETVRQMIQQALRETQAQGRVRVHVHPADLANVETIYRELSFLMPGVALEILADPGVQRPGCVIHTEQGVIEATLEAQLETIRERFLALREKENGHADSPDEIS